MLDTTSVAIAHRPGALFDPDILDETPTSARRADDERTLQLHQLPPQTQDALKRMLADDDAPATEWSEAAIVQLHWVLLAELNGTRRMRLSQLDAAPSRAPAPWAAVEDPTPGESGSSRSPVVPGWQR